VLSIASCALLVCVLTFSVGCSTPKQFKGVAIGDSINLVSAVPPLLQTKKISCGPTCLAAVAAYWGKDFSPLLQNPLSDDFNADELSQMGGAIGLRVFEYKGSMPDLETNLAKGRPLIVLIPKPRYEDSPFTLTIQGVPLSEILMMVEPKRSHWIIVVGYTEFRIIVQDPAWGRIALPRGKFEQWWASKKNTCLLAVPSS
jgi:ABC-type bacteriocin/lantibiotic exporter with double-glycine peptidase domain